MLRGRILRQRTGGGGPNNLIDVSGITPDQQFQAGLFCGNVVCDADDSDQFVGRANLCPAASYGSKYVSIPSPGTENDDHNPPRIAPRNLFDVAVGQDNLFHGDRYKWSLRLTAINVTDKVALYNFLSTFSGTHYVTPRALTAELGSTSRRDTSGQAGAQHSSRLRIKLRPYDSRQ